MIRRHLIRSLSIAFAAFAAVSIAAAQPLPPPPPPQPAPTPPEATVTLQTTMGDIVIRLESKKAPWTVANFIRYVKAGYFDNIRIYRVMPAFLIQMGDVQADGGVRTPLFNPVRLETATGLVHGRGMVALAHADGRPNSGDTTFYIDLGPNASLNPKPGAKPNTTGYAVFGRVIKGIEVADKIAAVPRKPKSAGGEFPGQEPVTPVVIKKVVLVEGK
jgi:peptidyl-prolyl cis-trans isomerase A (cyclophilin A)